MIIQVTHTTEWLQKNRGIEVGDKFTNPTLHQSGEKSRKNFYLVEPAGKNPIALYEDEVEVVDVTN